MFATRICSNERTVPHSHCEQLHAAHTLARNLLMFGRFRVTPSIMFFLPEDYSQTSTKLETYVLACCCKSDARQRRDVM